jgi:hypothetical protein
MRDEGGPLDAGSQVQASNHCKLLSSKAMVVSVAAKAGLRPERLDRRTGLRLAKLRVKLRFPMGVAQIGFHRALADVAQPARQHGTEINRLAHERGERTL